MKFVNSTWEDKGRSDFLSQLRTVWSKFQIYRGLENFVKKWGFNHPFLLKFVYALLAQYEVASIYPVEQRIRFYLDTNQYPARYFIMGILSAIRDLGPEISDILSRDESQLLICSKS